MESTKPDTTKSPEDDDDFFDNEDEKDGSGKTSGDSKLKKQKSSYTYWVQNNKDQFPQSQDTQLIAPMKLDDPKLV